MRKILLVAAATATFNLACAATYAQHPTNVQLAQATPTAPAAPAAEPAPAAPVPQAAQPDAAPQTAAKSSRPAKKRAVRRRETDEEKARRIAAKYGVSW
jgi:hypothetical protein